MLQQEEKMSRRTESARAAFRELEAFFNGVLLALGNNYNLSTKDAVTKQYRNLGVLHSLIEAVDYFDAKVEDDLAERERKQEERAARSRAKAADAAEVAAVVRKLGEEGAAQLLKKAK